MRDHLCEEGSGSDEAIRTRSCHRGIALTMAWNEIRKYMRNEAKPIMILYSKEEKTPFCVKPNHFAASCNTKQHGILHMPKPYLCPWLNCRARWGLIHRHICMYSNTAWGDVRRGRIPGKPIRPQATSRQGWKIHQRPVGDARTRCDGKISLL